LEKLSGKEIVMPEEILLAVNGKLHTVQAAADTPLLYVLRNELGLNGPHFGCGGEKCGACMVLVGAEPRLSCHLPISEIGSARITTLEGLIVQGELHPVQQAFIEEQATQCGYCINGMIISTAALLWKNHHPTDREVRAALDGNLCRCGAHLRILRAVRRAEQIMWGEALK
jgi:nicotinate dehydrogenase subunit A